MTKRYYDDQIEAAVRLSEEQKADGWSFEDREKYWDLLGYDEFFIRQVVKP